MRNTTPQIATAEISDADLDNVSGGIGGATLGGQITGGLDGVSGSVNGGILGVGGVSGNVSGGLAGAEGGVTGGLVG